MKRNSKAVNDGRENKRNRSYHISPIGHAAFTRQCRKQVRVRANQDLRMGKDPLPKDTKAKEYYD